MAKYTINTTSTLSMYQLILTNGCTRLSTGSYEAGIWASEMVMPKFTALGTVMNPSNLSCGWYSFLFRSTFGFWRKDNHRFHHLKHFLDGDMGDMIDCWANFVSLKLTCTNYLLWETQVLALIESQDLLGFITGDIPQPATEIEGTDGKVPNPALAPWKRTDRLVKAWIMTTISEEALGTVVGLTTSFDVWKALTNAYSQDSQAREFELLLKLQEKKKASTSLVNYIRDFKSTCDHSMPLANQCLIKTRYFGF
ncbi:hypothetical protein LWI28_021934 [Acer negundo]|uniref:Uncharacterized protein n=1 Tax=Acer negundo TaxID=4023 RepID=A0AAD5JMA7_ACENE|nr:hypothetical protein LWI28_021934 [Acer negundo]